MTNARRSSLALFLMGMFMVSMMAPGRGYAVPASPDVHVLEQPDGTQFNALQWGDENRSGWETEDGYTIVFEEKMNRWTYARQGYDGSLVGTSYLAGKDVPPADMKKRIRPQGRPAINMLTSKEEAFATTGPLPLRTHGTDGVGGPELVVPSAGSGNMPVILINFPGRTTTFNAASFNTMLFGTGNNSMKDYYDEVSYGIFHLSGGPGISGHAVPVAGWYTSTYSHDYYGAGNPDAYAGTLVREAVAKADNDGFQFEAYDSDGDCYVDVVAIVHQGTGQEASPNSYDIWSHRWKLSSAYSYGSSDGGEYTTSRLCPGHPGVYMKVNDYIIMPEKYSTGISTMGVFAHEYGHSFGLPDLYDTDSTGSEGIGNWSLMAGGSWCKVSRPGDRPSHMDAWSKYFLGWVAPTKVTSPLFSVPIAAVETTPVVYQLLNGSPASHSGEYFLVENRQKTGFDAGLPGPGLLIWHIDEAMGSLASNDYNDFECLPWSGWECTPSNHYHVALVQADNWYDLEVGSYYGGNRGDAGDPFPGSTGKRSFSGTSDLFNNSSLYNGWPANPSNVIITSIGNSGAVMTASMSAALPATSLLADALDNPTQTDGSTPLNFTTGGSGNWTGQNLVAFAGGSAAQSPALLNSQSSSFQTTVTGPASIGFTWKVSSQPASDYVKFSIDGVEKARISGEKNWQSKGFFLLTGTHTLTWTYVKNGSIASGFDAAWVDKVVVNPYVKVAVAAPLANMAAGYNESITWTAPVHAALFTVSSSLSAVPIATKIAKDSMGSITIPWTLPSINGNKIAKITVKAYDAANVLIGTGVSAPFNVFTTKIDAPNGAESFAGGSGQSIDFWLGESIIPAATVLRYYTLNAGSTWTKIDPDIAYAGAVSYASSWTLPVVTGTPKTKCKVKLVLKSATGSIISTDMSDGFFTITP